MTANEESSDIAELASETVAPIEQELRQRLTVALRERDALAVESALLKAFLCGMQEASAQAAEAAIDQVDRTRGVGGELMARPASLNTRLPRLDPWAARYGED